MRAPTTLVTFITLSIAQIFSASTSFTYNVASASPVAADVDGMRRIPSSMMSNHNYNVQELSRRAPEASLKAIKIDNKTYDLSGYKHPGPPLTKFAGPDFEKEFRKKHGKEFKFEELPGVKLVK